MTDGVKLFVGRLPRSADEDTIKNKVAEFGDVLEVYIFRDRETKQSKGAAFVRCANIGSATNAIENLNGKCVMDPALGALSVSLANGEAARLGLSGGNHAHVNGSDEQAKLFVGGLPFDYSKPSLDELFSRFGEIVDSHIMVHKETGRSKGSAFVIFKNRSDALHAIESLKNHTIMPMTRPVNVKFADVVRPRSANANTNANPGRSHGVMPGYNGPPQNTFNRPTSAPQQQPYYQDAYNQNTIQIGSAPMPYNPDINAMQISAFPRSDNGMAAPMQLQSYGFMPVTMMGMQQQPVQQQSPTPEQRGPWTQFYTNDHRPYYHNRMTDQTQWDTPVEFAQPPLPPQVTA